MTSKLKCPFCGEEIISDLCLMCDKIDKGYTSGRQIYKCNKCSLFGNKELWQALIQSQTDLEIANEKIEVLEHNYSVKSEQHERGYAYATKTIKDLESKLKIARNPWIGTDDK